MSRHTPGPWAVDKAPVSKALCVQSKTTWICGQLYEVKSSSDFARDEALANARLIAAAPDLLAALRTARNALGQIGQGIETDIAGNVAAANAAIERAAGRIV